MRKTPIRVAALSASLGVALLLPALAATTASAAPKDRSGLDTSATNGGDKGWGNCGYNSSGGRHHTALDDGGKNPGNGGFTKGQACSVPVVVPPAEEPVPVAPTESGPPTSPEPTSPEPTSPEPTSPEPTQPVLPGVGDGGDGF